MKSAQTKIGWYRYCSCYMTA